MKRLRQRCPRKVKEQEEKQLMSNPPLYTHTHRHTHRDTACSVPSVCLLLFFVQGTPTPAHGHVQTQTCQVKTVEVGVHAWHTPPPTNMGNEESCVAGVLFHLRTSGDQGCVGNLGGGAPLASRTPRLWPAALPLTADASFIGFSDRQPQPRWQPPPTACLTASGAPCQAPSLLMHSWSRPQHAVALVASPAPMASSLFANQLLALVSP